MAVCLASGFSCCLGYTLELPILSAYDLMVGTDCDRGKKVHQASDPCTMDLPRPVSPHPRERRTVSFRTSLVDPSRSARDA